MSLSRGAARMHARGATGCPDVRALYHIMQSMEGKLGGGEGIEGLYGSITRTGMQKVLDSLAANCGLSNNSHIVDVGAGLGRPLLHALVSPGVASGYGIEIDSIKCNKAAAFLQHSVRELAKRASGVSVCAPKIQCSSIEKVPSLDPATHAYSFWEGVPTEAKCAFGELFAKSETMQSVAVVQRAMRGRDPAEEMLEMGFGCVKLVDSFAVSMSGSGRSFTSYIFKKDSRIEPTCGVDIPATPALVTNHQRSSLDSTETNVTIFAEPHSKEEPVVDINSARLIAEGRKHSELLVPSTPSIADGRPDSAHVATPPTNHKILAGVSTPKSSGVSGQPRRVSQSDQGRIATNPVLVTRGHVLQPMLSKSLGESLYQTGSRRSSRLQKQAPAAPKLQERLSPTKPKVKAKQKSKSPVKTLEAAGFRSKRGAGNAARKILKLPNEKATFQARGLGDLHLVK